MNPSLEPVTAKGGHLVLPLQRPQYMVPEAFGTALAWSMFSVELKKQKDSPRVLALQYRADDRSSTKTLDFRRTDPVTDPVKLAEFAQALAVEGLKAEVDQNRLAEAVANSICGIRPEKSKSQSAASLTVGTALLQNVIGIAGSKGAPNLGAIIEGLFGLGQERGLPALGAAQLWARATDRRVQIDPVLNAIDKAVRSTLLDSQPKLLAAASSDPETRKWIGLLDQTPFTWFHRMWERITGDEWVEALPARVWVDWASTILRLGLGMGFLWEAAWNETVARRVISGDRLSWEGLRSSVPDPLPWRSDLAQTSVRDVASLLGRRSKRSEPIRTHLDKWIKDNKLETEDIESVLAAMSSDRELRESLTKDLGGVLPKKSNLWEAIRYTLLVREESGQFADHYGLLRTRGRYLMPDPGTEWIAVVASLCCPGPSTSTDLGNVMSSLAELGLKPDLTDVVVLLERAGLARGSADADQGVVVQSAF
jgi:hypothetical protein